MQFICLKEKKFHRSLSLCLVFFVSFSMFCFGFGTKNIVKANPLVPVVESELAPIIINILSSFGVVVSIPVARDFLEQEKDFCTQKALELQNHRGAVTKGIQALKEGYYVSKDFVIDVLNEWEKYSIEKNITSTYTKSCYTVTSNSVLNLDSDKFPMYLTSLFSPLDGIVINSKVFNSIIVSYYTTGYRMGYGTVTRWAEQDYHYFHSDSCFFDKPLHFSVKAPQTVMCNGKVFSSYVQTNSGVKIDLGSYNSKVKLNKQVIDNALNPVSEKNQGLVISPQNVEAVGKVLNPSIPDVKGSEINIDVPISSFASTVPNIQNASDVGALDWGVPIDKPTDIPKDESKDIPKDESKDTPKDDAGVDFSPFLTLGTGLKDVFPFCLPFDLIKNLHLLSAPPQAPHFDIDFKKAGLAGGDVVSIDFSQFELLAKIIRFFLTLGFIYFLIIKTRDMIRG
ncbi:hypothetical protein QTI71_14895 [Clostridium perfringens]|nr:hypothetical protein [Clostridium perfringens]